MKSAFFLDRDGVINVEVSYLSRPEDTVLISGAAEAIAAIHHAGMLAVVVTNQSGIARKMYTLDDVQRVHARLQALLLASGADCVLDGFYCCCHHPDYTGVCDCRKPAPGMLLQAAKELEIDLSSSVMIGDRMSDLNAGKAAGCRVSALVRTGYGEKEIAKAEAVGFPVFADLTAAVRALAEEKM